jgi:hypothetical protein
MSAAQRRRRQTVIRVPIVIRGKREPAWNMDDIQQTIAYALDYRASEFSMCLIQKNAITACLLPWHEKVRRLLRLGEFSIRPIEILNCTFHPNSLYQRYIQVAARATRKAVVGHCRSLAILPLLTSIFL